MAMNKVNLRISVLLFVAAWLQLFQSTHVFSEDQAFSPTVVEKANRILKEFGLRRMGKSLQSTETSSLSRTISKLGKRKRELRKTRQEWEQADHFVKHNREQLRAMTLQDGNLNLEMARVAGRDVRANNRLVGLINANRAKMKLMQDQEISLKKRADEKRSTLSDAEAGYAEEVIQLRQSYDEIVKQVNQALAEEDVQTAIQVVSRNYEVPEDQTAETILKVLDKKIQKIEQAIFREAIPMLVEQGSLYVDVVIGEKSVRMVVDSGATLITIPAKDAADLGIAVPSDAPKLRLVMADGSSIEGRKVKLARVRVGNFEASDVEAAVLEASAISAEPLLGMSYLGNFKFEVDAAARQLKMLRISAQ